MQTFETLGISFFFSFFFTLGIYNGKKQPLKFIHKLRFDTVAIRNSGVTDEWGVQAAALNTSATLVRG